MTKLLIMLITVFSIGTITASGEILPTSENLIENSYTNCLSDGVLNCSGGADGHHVYEQEMECPIGGQKFKGYFLGTHSTYGRHLDWEPVSYMRFPIPIPVCPSSGFVMFKEKFSKEELKEFKEILESKEYSDLYSQKHATYYLFAKMVGMQKEKSDKIDLWWLYLNATWEADNCKNKERYKEYALETISATTKELEKLKDTEELYWILKVVTANMYRRIGDFKSAQELIDKFGTPALKNEENNKFYILALKLLKKSVKEKNTDRVPISDARDEFRKKT